MAAQSRPPDPKPIPAEAHVQDTSQLLDKVTYTMYSAGDCTETGMWVGPKLSRKKRRCSKHPTISVQCSRLACNRELTAHPNERGKYN